VTFGTKNFPSGSTGTSVKSSCTVLYCPYRIGLPLLNSIHAPSGRSILNSSVN